MRPRELAATFACLMVLLTVPLAARAQTSASFQPLGLGPGGIASSATAVSADGSVVVGTFWIPNHPFCRFPGVGDCTFAPHGFRWEAGAFQDLGALNPNAPEVFPLAVSGDGSKIVGWSRAISGISSFERPFVWTAAGGMQELPNIPASVDARATGISRDGNVVVGHFLTLGVGGGDHAFLWSAGVMTDLGVVPGTRGSKALGVCGLGAAVVGNSTFAAAWRWRPNVGMENLGGAIARGCSVDGSVVVGDSFANNTTIATRWDPKNGLRTLGALGGIGSQAQAVSADGSVVVGDAGLPFVIIGGFSTSEFTAFRWSAGKMSQVSRILQSLGVTTPFCHSFSDAAPCPPGSWFLKVGNGVSADGSVIVGFAVDPDGNDHAFRAVVSTANAVCTPTTCAAQGKNCGTIPNGCGGTLTCGVCTAPQLCGGGGVANVCGLATLSSLALNPTSVVGGNPSTGTVTLTAAAPAGGAVATLASGGAAASVPASVTVAAGATSANFTVTTSAVTASTVTSISASLLGSTATALLTVNPAAACTPTTCAALGKNCGSIADGCGGTLLCGSCTAPQTCGGAGIANVCGTSTVSTALLTLTATGRTGETVSSSPVGLRVNVGTTGSASFATGTVVTLSVTNGRDAIWSGGCSSGGAKTKTCSVTINAATSVTANVQ